MHPAAKAVGGARTRERAAQPASPAPSTVLAAESAASEELLGVSSMARAVAGEANITDVGALSWMMLKPMVPAAAMGLFVIDDERDAVVNCFAAGVHASMIRHHAASPGDGVVGWVAAHRRPATNAEAALDFGLQAASLEPPLHSAFAIPLVHEGTLIAVLAMYGTTRNAFTDDHIRLFDLLAPRLAAALATVRAAQATSDRQATASGSAFKLLKGRRTG
jgi:GAF domain-containing protein